MIQAVLSDQVAVDQAMAATDTLVAEAHEQAHKNADIYQGCSTLTLNPCEGADYTKCEASSVYSNEALGHGHGKGGLDSDQAWSAWLMAMLEVFACGEPEDLSRPCVDCGLGDGLLLR